MVNTINRKPERSPASSPNDPEFDAYGEPGSAISSNSIDVEATPESLLDTPARKVALGLALLMLALVGSTLVWVLSTRPSAGVAANTAGLEVAPRSGALAPDFELLDVRANAPVRLSALRGKPVFINFWGTWCPPCRDEMPEMQKLRNKYGDQLQILGISMAPRDDPPTVKSFVDSFKYDWTFIHDADYSVATTYQVMAVPSSYFIDKAGVIRAVHIGGMNYDQMDQYVQKTR